MQTRRLTNDEFAERLNRGQQWERAICGRLRAEGLDAYIPAPPTESELNPEDSYEYRMLRAKMYANQPDIICEGLVIEHKTVDLNFDAPDNYPHPNIFIDTRHGFDSKKDIPFMTIVTSLKSGKSIMIHTDSTREKWDCRLWRDPKVGQEYKYSAKRHLWMSWADGINFIKQLTKKE